MNLFSFLLPSHQSFFVFYLFIFFHSPPPLLVCHFSLFLPLLPSRLASASFPSLPVFSLCCLCLSAVVRVSWTDGVCVACCPDTHGQTHTQTQRHTHVAVLFPPPRPVKPGKYCSSAPLPPPCPRCGRNHKPNGPLTLVVWSLHTTHDSGTV